MKLSKGAYTKLFRDAGPVEKQHEPPSPAAIIARDKAVAAAAKQPLAYALGEPLPGRSALDKLRAQQAAAAAAANESSVIRPRVWENLRGKTRKH